MTFKNTGNIFEQEQGKKQLEANHKHSIYSLYKDTQRKVCFLRGKVRMEGQPPTSKYKLDIDLILKAAVLQHESTYDCMG